ncbi:MULTISPECIES: TrkH family potassium uptake protein [Prosthecochloris]|uniref:ATPase n=1 Tax=Prosthecochloris vibrioformis TaxID=1098 RepID=A0A5C4S3S5_PROVB|nr:MULTISPECIES: potassium transporter TrkG [Prosthecochloris]ANT65656.1 Ktr system potassium uptake protein B [Prosthecochloris sp. CIB 2401]TNJ37965.1 ATPase [Prosthecochloris vibrioformis]
MSKLIVKPGIFNAGRHQSPLVAVADKVVMLLAFPAVFSLVAEYGFYLSPEEVSRIQLLDLAILWVFAICGFVKLLLVVDKAEYFRSHWADVLILFLISFLLFFPQQITAFMHSIIPGVLARDIAKIYIVLTQVMLFMALVPPGIRYSQRLMSLNIQPAVLIIFSFLLFIVLGTFFLLLPRASVTGSLSLIDALFMSTSAVCVTGLAVVNPAEDLTLFGQGVIMVLIQLGGLGIMTMTTFFAYIVGSSGSGLKEYATLQTLLGEESLGKIRSTVFQVVLFAFSIELAGALLLFMRFDEFAFASVYDQLFFALFHSISAFCNAGFSLWSENLMASEVIMDMPVLTLIMVLIILGGLGFPVIANINAVVTHRLRMRFTREPSDELVVENAESIHALRQEKLRERKVRLSLHSKLVLFVSALLIILGTFGVFLLERHGVFAGMSLQWQLFYSLFHSVSARTAGFNTVDIGAFSMPALFFLALFMWVGASPGSTGGGIKTTTLALALLNIFAIVSGRNRIELFRKQVPAAAVVKAFSTVILSVFYIALALFVLLLTEPFSFRELLFEIVSAVGTVGLSTGITAGLSSAGKLVVVFSMFVGRIGLLSVMSAVIRQKSYGRYTYTEENVMI